MRRATRFLWAFLCLILISGLTLVVQSASIYRGAASLTDSSDVKASVAGDVIYVNAAAPGGDGSSWANAFKQLQDALGVSKAGDQIWVAQGTYRPDRGGGNIPGDRRATFQLKNGVAIYGGFAGSETSLNDRNWQTHKTILSGDLAGDDCFYCYFTNNGENSYNIVTGNATDLTAIIDGFTITGGNANGVSTYWDECGGGMLNLWANTTVANCSFNNNWAYMYGGGMYNYSANPAVANCIFSENTANSDGGGMYNDYSSNPAVINCIFTSNMAISWGGGMANYGSSPTVINCTFSANSANNEAGGGMADECCGGSTVINCTFTSNMATSWGGGIYSSGLTSMTNCILWANNAPDGSQLGLEGATLNVTYSNIQGGLSAVYTHYQSTINWGNGNINLDPVFMDSGHGNLRLSAGSPCIDAGNSTIVPPEVTTDLDGHSRFVDDPLTVDTGYGIPPIVDMGAYEYEPSLTQTPVIGITREVDGSILAGVSITLDGGVPVVSNQDGRFVVMANAIGSHTVVAYKYGFRDRSQTVNIAGLGPGYAVPRNFQGQYGLIPNAPDIWYALNCVNRWLYPPNPDIGLDIWTALNVINAWLYPVTPTSLADSWIAFGWGMYGPTNPNYDIYLIRGDGRDMTQLTNYPRNEWLDSWSPDGTKVLFENDRTGNFSVYEIDSIGGGLVRLTNGTSGEYQGSWSPDGSKIAFVQCTQDQYTGGLVGDIWAMNADGTNKVNLTNSATTELCPRWSPNGSKIAYVGYYDQAFQIYTMDTDGSNKTRLTVTGNNYYPMWSPDSSKIVFVSERDGNAEIYIMGSGGSSQTRLTNNTVTDCYPSFSPDGKMIAFYSDLGKDIWVMNSDGSSLRDITNDPQSADWPCVYLANYGWATGDSALAVIETKGEFTAWRWLHDGNHIAFISHDMTDDSDAIKVVGVSGGNATVLVTAPGTDYLQPCIVSPVLRSGQ